MTPISNLARRRPLGRGFLTLGVVAALGSVGVLATHAALSDTVSMAEISVSGGSLDLKANGGDGPNQAWTGQVSAAITGMEPGDEKTGTVEITNSGSVPFALNVSTTGTDASSCFEYYFRETSASGATKDASFPTNITGMGTGAGSDATEVPFATPVTNQPLYDVTSGSDATWETDDDKTYTVTVREKTSCTTNDATGTLDFTFNAAQ